MRKIKIQQTRDGLIINNKYEIVRGVVFWVDGCGDFPRWVLELAEKLSGEGVTLCHI